MSADIGSLRHLNRLDLSHNEFSGVLPDTIGSLDVLQILTLSFNKLQGPLPSSFRKLENVTELQLDHNAFSGQLPNFEGLAHIQTLDLRENDPGFSGAIPDYIGDTGRNARGETIVTTINIAGNNLTGTLPATIMHLTNLRVLNVSGNRLSGFIPELPSSLDDIENLDENLRSRVDFSGANQVFVRLSLIIGISPCVH